MTDEEAFLLGMSPKTTLARHYMERWMMDYGYVLAVITSYRLEIRTLPEWFPMDAITLVPLGAVYVKKSHAKSVALLQHELVHVRQQVWDGKWRFFLRYIFSGKWRLKYEAEAYTTNIRNGSLTESEAANLLSSSMYLWCASRNEAVVALRCVP